MSKERKKNMTIITLQISHHNRKTETILKPSEKSIIEKYKNFKKKRKKENLDELNSRYEAAGEVPADTSEDGEK